ncbi:DUF3592 domain-containing protein [Arthrobacter sp. UC242_113]|uniref:DUF3592 domain-containing protein n=1 Tax=Arthrobacter sp. UC242_113 TaxID=3374550 RepID=UPI0037573147
MNSPDTAAPRKAQTFWSSLGGFTFVALLLLTGPVLIGIGSLMTDADEELERTGVHTTGTIVDFDDVRNASKRDITVHYMSADGAEHSTFASVDHDQQPKVGDDVTVIYREQNPSQAVVVAYRDGGVSVGGIGALFTLIFTIPLGLTLIIMKFRKRRKQRTV